MRNVKLYRKDYSNINSFLLMLYIFSPTLTLPLNDFLDSGLPVWVLTAVILAVSFYINKNAFNIKTIVIILSIIIIFLINWLLLPYKEETTFILIEFIKFGAIPLYLASTLVNFRKVSKYWLILGIINFITLLFYIEQINQQEFNYMTFGRYMSLSFIIFAIYYYENKFRKSMFILMLTTMFAVFIFGNRSAIAVIIIILIYFEVKQVFSKRSLFQYFKISLTTLILIVLALNIRDLVYKLINFLEANGLNSYSFRKMTALFDNNIGSFVSGRDNIYFETINLIYDSNLMPKGIGYYQYVTDRNYPHNVFLDMTITFGFLGILAFVLVIVIFLVKYLKMSDSFSKQLIAVLGIYQFIILNFSGTFWSEPIMWMLLGFLISNNYIERNIIFTNLYGKRGLFNEQS